MEPPRLSAGLRPVTTIERMLHVVGLCSIAVSQPLFDALTRNSNYRIEADLRWPELTLFVVLLVAVVPAIAIAADHLLRQIARWIHGFGQDSVIIGLTFVAALSILRPLVSQPPLEERNIVWLVSTTTAFGLAAIVSRLYRLSAWFRCWLSVLAIATAVFPCVFAAQLIPIANIESAKPSIVNVSNPASVILVVFDEFSGLTLMNENGQLDAERFPHFGELGSAATWYRNATTVHGRTQMAVPAILTGRLPERDCDPHAENYPGNLFEVITSTNAYDAAVCEVYTRLYPRSARRRPVTRAFTQRLIDLLRTMAAIYPQLVFPRDIPLSLPEVPRTWYGMLEPNDDFRHTTGRMNLNSLPRDGQLDHFLQCVQASSRPRFHFLHVVLPHYPWCYLPSGKHYLCDDDAPLVPQTAVGDLGERWRDDPVDVARWKHRYELQVGFVDRFIGRLQERLKDQGLWDSSLLIVTADHGVSFRPGHSRRVPDAETLADLMSVPLFVKLPQQAAGGCDDRNVETIDIFPTILDQLGIQSIEPVDGLSLLEGTSRPRKSFRFHDQMTVVEPDFVIRSVKQNKALVRTGPLSVLPEAMSARPSWRQRPIADFVVDDAEFSSLEVGNHRLSSDTHADSYSPLLVEGTINSTELPQPVGQIAIAVDDHIVEVGPLIPAIFGTYGFSVLLPESSLAASRSRITLFHIPPGEHRRLTRLRTWTADEPGYSSSRD